MDAPIRLRTDADDSPLPSLATKPRIWRSGRLWHCGLRKGSPWIYWGRTPQEAWDNYVERDPATLSMQRFNR